MAIDFLGENHGSGGDAATATAISGVRTGDVLLACVFSDAIEHYTVDDSGWVDVLDTGEGAIHFGQSGTVTAWGRIMWKAATQSEPANYTFTCSGVATNTLAAVTAWRNVDPNNPISAMNYVSMSTASEAFSTPPVMTTNISKVLHIRAVENRADVTILTFTAASGTERFDFGRSDGTDSISACMYEVTGDLAVGTQNGLAITCSGTEETQMALTLALDAAPAMMESGLVSVSQQALRRAAFW